MALQGQNHAGMKDLQLEEKPSLAPCLLKSTRSPWVSPEWDRCNKAGRPLGRVKEKHRDVCGGWGLLTLLEVSIIHWRCWHFTRHTNAYAWTCMKKLYTCTLVYPLHDRRSLMNVALRRPLRGSKATLTPTSDRAGHREALARLHFPRLPDWQAVPRQVCSVKGWGPFLCLPVAVWQRHGRSALKECLFAAITVAGTVMGPFSSTIPTLSFSPFLCLYWCAPGTLSWYPTHTVSVLWPHSSDCINSDYGRIILVCLAIKYTHVWLSRAASQAFIGTSPSPI